VGSGALTRLRSPKADTQGAILLLLSTLGIGGSESKFVKLAGSLAERGARVAIAYLGPPEDLLPAIDARVRVIALQRRGKFSFRSLRMLVGAIRSHEIATVVAVNLYPTLYVALARWWLGRKCFRFVVSTNTTDFVARKQELLMRLYGPILRKADLIIFGAQAQRQLWRERYGAGRRGQDTAVLYNGVDTIRFARRGRFGDPRSVRPDTRYVIGTVGRLRMEKAHIHLVRATAQLRSRGFDVGTLIVGEGGERAALAAEIERCDLQKYVILTGAARDVRPFVACMDVFVLPSVAVETFSNAALEAMAMGVPVLASAVGGIQELLAHGGGVTYSPGDINQLTQLLAELLPDGDRRHALGEAGRRAVTDHFGWARTVDAFSALLWPRPERAETAPVPERRLLDRTYR
jgi:glycosyltransferase involved in cell wall biosynthesis